MRTKVLVLSLCVVALAGCQTMGGSRAPSSPTPAPAASTGQAPTPPAAPSPWELARQRGMAFRATGSEPDWSVEVQKSAPPTLFVVLQDRQRNLTVANARVSSQRDEGMVTFRGNADDGTPVELIIHRGQCQQDMSGQKTAAAVLLYVGAQQYTGCGRFLLH